MACTITFTPKGFTAPIGQPFTVNVTPPTGGGLAFLHIIYAGGDPVKAAPYTFNVKAGVNNMHVFYSPDSAAQLGKQFTLIEDCGAGATQPLAVNDFDFSDPHFAVQIEGV